LTSHSQHFLRFALSFGLIVHGVFTPYAAEVADKEDVKIVGIAVKGNDKTKEEIILREVPIEVGATYNEKALMHTQLELARWNLTNLNLFNQIDIDTVKPRNGELIIEITVLEKWFFWPIPFLEFADRNFSQWYEFNFDSYRTNYGLYLFKYNLLGRNHTAKLALVNGYNREIGANYRIPWFAGMKNLGLEIKSYYTTNHEVWYKTENDKLLFYRDLDKTLLKRSASEIKINIRPKYYVSHQPYLQYNSLWVDDTISSDALNSLFLIGSGSHQNEFRLGYRVTYEKVNNRFFPTEGFSISANAAYSQFMKGGGYPWMNFRSSIIMPMGLVPKNWSYAIGVLGGFRVAETMKSNVLPYEHYRAIGYENQMRGYETYVIDGPAFGMVQAEIRYHLISGKNIRLPYALLENYRQMPTEVFLSLFVDQGIVKDGPASYSNELTATHLLGYGIGLNALFYYDKVFRFEYSFNKLGGNGLKLHFKRSF